MTNKLKKLADQVVVITGATSGIGLATAEAAARGRAKLVLLARSENTLNTIVDSIIADGGDAIGIVCDMSDSAAVRDAAELAVARFGRIDTWVNNAGMGMWGRLDETEEVDAKRLFEINFWGVVNGCLAALPYLKAQGGALINVGSEVSDAYPPIQGMYAATKHAVKGYTDALRVEIEEVDKAPVSITLIQPTAVDTPFPEHARNFTSKEPKLPTPMIKPEDVAESILDAAISPTRAKTVGTMSLIDTTMSKFVPSLADKMAAKQVDRQNYDEVPRRPQGTLYQSGEAIGVIGRKYGSGGVEAH